MTIAEQFIAAWEAAGKPPVDHGHYPSAGHARSTRIFEHCDVYNLAHQGERFHDDGKYVEVAWDMKPTLAEGLSSTNRLIFEKPKSTRIHDILNDRAHALIGERGIAPEDTDLILDAYRDAASEEGFSFEVGSDQCEVYRDGTGRRVNLWVGDFTGNNEGLGFDDQYGWADAG